MDVLYFVLDGNFNILLKLFANMEKRGKRMIKQKMQFSRIKRNKDETSLTIFSSEYLIKGKIKKKIVSL